MPSSKSVLWSLGIVSLAFFGACSSSGGGGSAGGPTGGDCTKLDFSQYSSTSKVSFETDVVPVLTAHLCAASGCHNASEHKAGLSLWPREATPPFDAPTLQAAYASLTGTATTVTDGTVKRVTPGDPARSFLIDKLSGTQNAKGFTCKNQDPSHTAVQPPLACGDDMPLAGPGNSLCALGGSERADFDTLVEWVAEGAPGPT